MGMLRQLPKRAELVRRVSGVVKADGDGGNLNAGHRVSVAYWRVPLNYADGGARYVTVKWADADRGRRRDCAWGFSGRRSLKARPFLEELIECLEVEAVEVGAAARVVVEAEGGEGYTGRLGPWLELNDFDVATKAEIKAELGRGRVYRGGGGAAPAWSVRLLVDLASEG